MKKIYEDIKNVFESKVAFRILVGVGIVLVSLLIFCLVVWLVYYIITNVLPEPMRHIATVIAVVLVCLILIVWLSQGGLTGLSLGRLGPCR